MSTERFQELEKRIRQLRINLLPKGFSKTGSYDSKTLDKAKGYRLLVHAEIEAYFEDMAQSILTDAINKWYKLGKATYPLIAYLVYYHTQWGEIDLRRLLSMAKQNQRSNKVTVEEKIKEIMATAERQYHDILVHNNGIKEENLLKILRPVGIDIDDSQWLSDISSIAVRRGDVAHNSVHTAMAINPKDEKVTVNRIVAGIKIIDKKYSHALEQE